jgi:hypothetical protein
MPDAPIAIHTPFLLIDRWAEALEMSTSKVRRLNDAGVLDLVKDGKRTRVRQTPAHYLSSLPPMQKGTMPAGPGRGHRRGEAA